MRTIASGRYEPRSAPPQTTRIVDRHGRPIAELFNERRTVVPLEKIPPVLRKAVIAEAEAFVSDVAAFDAEVAAFVA